MLDPALSQLLIVILTIAVVYLRMENGRLRGELDRMRDDTDWLVREMRIRLQEERRKLTPPKPTPNTENE